MLPINPVTTAMVLIAVLLVYVDFKKFERGVRATSGSETLLFICLFYILVYILSLAWRI